MTLFSINIVHAETFINTDLYPNLVMPRNVRFYGWSSNTQYEVLQTSCTDSSSSNQYCYFGASGGEPFYNDANGFSIYFDLPNSVPKGTSLNLDYIMCGTNSNNYYNGTITYGIGTTPSNVLTDNYNPTDVSIQSLTAITDDIFNFKSCRRFNVSLTTPDTGTRFALRIRSTSNVDFGILALMGITSTNYGFDYSTQFNEMTEQQEITNEKLDEIIDADAPPSVKPDDEKYDDYESVEGDLKDKVNEADLSNLSIGIDSSSSKWVWETLTDLLQSHSAIFGMVIAILSIGIIKLALGR